jgi:hypothetical protein
LFRPVHRGEPAIGLAASAWCFGHCLYPSDRYWRMSRSASKLAEDAPVPAAGVFLDCSHRLRWRKHVPSEEKGAPSRFALEARRLLAPQLA